MTMKKILRTGTGEYPADQANLGPWAINFFERPDGSLEEIDHAYGWLDTAVMVRDFEREQRSEAEPKSWTPPSEDYMNECAKIKKEIADAL